MTVSCTAILNLNHKSWKGVLCWIQVEQIEFGLRKLHDKYNMDGHCVENRVYFVVILQHFLTDLLTPNYGTIWNKKWLVKHVHQH